MSLIVGLDDFGKACENGLNFIDKSLFIKELLDNDHIEAAVIIRPRRFGKTFNLSMLQHFLAPEVNGLKTQGMFNGLKIAEAGDLYMQEQGKYPVIFISFKSIKKQNFADSYAQLIELMSQTYRQHDYLLSSSKLKDYERKIIERIITKNAIEPSLLENSLYELSNCLLKHHGMKPWLLIDEYDTPIQSAYLQGYYDEMIGLMRSLLGSALKGNPHIHRAVITGILRIAKENLFSGVNNLDVYSILSPEYAQHFGFTQEEVDAVLAKENLTGLSDEIKKWYNGYHIGKYQIYNPWSIANCINKQGAIKAYWVNTSDNLLIKQTMARADERVKMQFETILAGKPIKVLINENTIFADLDQDSEALWGLFLFSGYLTALENHRVDIKSECVLTPPNQEVACLYPDIISSWFLEGLGEKNYYWFLKSLTEGDLETFLEILQRFLRTSASYFDVKGTEPERFYHGLVMGLIVGLSGSYRIQSNQESGYGRYDVMLIPQDLQKIGLVIEFKVGKVNKPLQETAEEALAQITARHYDTELQHCGVERILKIGLGFRDKEVALASS